MAETPPYPGAPRWAFRKLSLTAHLTLSIGWLGTVVAFVALATAAVTSRDVSTLRGAYVSMALLVSYVIVPMAFGSLLTGLVCALTTPWGLVRHYWVLIKLVLTVIAIGILLRQLEPIEALARLAREATASIANLPERARPLIHSAGGLIVLLVVQVLGVYKPRGMTPYGWRKHHEARVELLP